MAPGVSPDERIAVEDADEVSLDPDDDVLAGEEPRHAVPGPGEDDPAVAVDLSQVPVRSQVANGRRRRRGIEEGLGGDHGREFGRLHGAQPETLGRGPLA
jgi:hypothetical protein